MRQIDKTYVPPIRDQIGFGHQIRSYVQDRGYVKDLRTGVVQPFDATMDGDLDDLLRAALVQGCGKPLSPNAPVPEIVKRRKVT